MTPALVIAAILAALVIVATVWLAAGWVIEHGDPQADRPRLVAVKAWRFVARFYNWAAARGELGVLVGVGLVGAVYLGLCLAAVAVLRAIPGLVP